MKTPLRKIRLKKGKTLAEVALAVGSDTGNLSRIERGDQTPSLELAEKLSKYFNGRINEMKILYPERYMDETK